MVHVLTPSVIDPAIVNWNELPEEEVYPGIHRQTITASQQTMVRYRYQPGSTFPVHAHPQEQITLVLSGTITFIVAGSEFRLGPGDVAVIPGGVEHSATVEGDEAVETFNALSPRREAGPGPSVSHSGE